MAPLGPVAPRPRRPGRPPTALPGRRWRLLRARIPGVDQAGAGGTGVADAKAFSTSTADAGATATQYGGAGGAGADGANGGAGAGSSLYNGVTGSTAGGYLLLSQSAFGGAGGASAGGLAGGAGAAKSYLAFDDNDNAVGSTLVQASSGANGGAGGSGSGGSSGAAGAAGDATLVLTGSQQVVGLATGYGGAGGAGATTGDGGDGRAVAKVYGAAVTAQSYARGWARLCPGLGRSQDQGQWLERFFGRAAAAPWPVSLGHLIYGATHAYGAVYGVTKAKAKMGVGGYAQAFTYRATAIAQQEATPNAASIGAVMTANANIAAAFGASPSIFSIDEFGGGYALSGGSGPQTITDTINLEVDLTKLSPLGDLIVGFFNPVATGAPFTSLTFTLVADGDTASPLISETFTSVAAADAFFADGAVDLGSLASGALSASPLLLTATFTLTTAAAGSGYYVEMIAGDPPAASPPGAASRLGFAQAMASMDGGGGAGGGLMGAAPASTSPRLAVPPS